METTTNTHPIHSITALAKSLNTFKVMESYYANGPAFGPDDLVSHELRRPAYAPILEAAEAMTGERHEVLFRAAADATHHDMPEDMICDLAVRFHNDRDGFDFYKLTLEIAGGPRTYDAPHPFKFSY